METGKYARILSAIDYTASGSLTEWSNFLMGSYIRSVVKVDRRIRWHYTTTIFRLRIGARLTRYRNCKFQNFARTISRHADGISRYSVPPSAGPLLPLYQIPHIMCSEQNNTEVCQNNDTDRCRRFEHFILFYFAQNHTFAAITNSNDLHWAGQYQSAISISKFLKWPKWCNHCKDH